jgi:AcrR family transcriptional regulator
MPRPKQRTAELREHVLTVAVRTLSREGPAGFTARGVAASASTSTPAIYELFGDKAGLLREVFFEGFRMLRRHLDAARETGDPRADLVALLQRYRQFVRANRSLAEVMFSRPFADYAPGPAERRASASVRILIVSRVRRCIDAGLLHGDETDIAHVLVALTQGLGAAENARRLGTSRESVNRRWTLALDAVLAGLAPANGIR